MAPVTTSGAAVKAVAHEAEDQLLATRGRHVSGQRSKIEAQRAGFGVARFAPRPYHACELSSVPSNPAIGSASYQTENAVSLRIADSTRVIVSAER